MHPNKTTLKRQRIVITLCLILVGILANATAHARGHENKSILDCLYAPVTHFDGTIADAAIATEDLSTLVTAVSTAGLVDALSAPGNLTVFAPTNAAFAAMPENVLDAILADPEGLLTSVLTYHVVPRRVDPRWIRRHAGVKTLAEQKIFVGNRPRHGGLKVNNSNILSCSAVQTSNGLVWVIDSVLLPQFLQ